MAGEGLRGDPLCCCPKDEEDEAAAVAVSPTSDEYFLVSLLQPGYRIYNRLLLVDDLLKELS